MLRLRPILHTSRLPEYSALLGALGLAEAGGSEFAAGYGRILLRSCPAQDPQDGTVELGFEVRVLAEFARRTAADGARAEAVQTGEGPAVRVWAPGGSFLAVPAGADPAGGGAAGADPALTVVVRWLTPEPGAVAAVLAAVGAREQGPGRFAAKNGGVVLVEPAAAASVLLAFEYDGDPAPLRRRLAGTATGLLPELRRTPNI